MITFMVSLAFLVLDGGADGAREAVCPFDSTAIYCGEDGEVIRCCPGDTPLCCSAGKMGCCPSGKPWACSDPKECYASEEETIRCGGIVTQCD